jgi:hypothetical protein
MIPYFNSSYQFNAVAGQEKYFIPNLSEAETLTFFIQSIRYQMRKNPRDQYFGTGRTQNVLSLPFNWHCERTLGGSNLFIYFFPDINYPMELTGLFRLQSVTASQDLSVNTTQGNLGIPTIVYTAPVPPPPRNFVIQPGQLVINGFDLQGAYADTNALVAFINTGVINHVTAGIFGLEFILTNSFGENIVVETAGVNPGIDNITFSNFSTRNGPFNLTFFPSGLDQYYINYLQYRLAERLCTAYNFVPPQGMIKQLLQYTQMISKRSSPMDLTINKISTITNKSSINYGQVNLGKGWTV